MSGKETGDLDAVLKVKEDPEVTAAANDAMAAIQKQQDEVWQKTSTTEKGVCATAVGTTGYLAITTKNSWAAGLWGITTATAAVFCADSAADLAGLAGEKKGPIDAFLTPKR